VLEEDGGRRRGGDEQASTGVLALMASEGTGRQRAAASRRNIWRNSAGERLGGMDDVRRGNI